MPIPGISKAAGPVVDAGAKGAVKGGKIPGGKAIAGVKAGFGKLGGIVKGFLPSEQQPMGLDRRKFLDDDMREKYFVDGTEESERWVGTVANVVNDEIARGALYAGNFHQRAVELALEAIIARPDTMPRAYAKWFGQYHDPEALRRLVGIVEGRLGAGLADRLEEALDRQMPTTMKDVNFERQTAGSLRGDSAAPKTLIVLAAVAVFLVVTR